MSRWPPSAEAAAATNISGTLALGERSIVELTASYESADEAKAAATALDGLLSENAGADFPPELKAALGRVHVGNVSTRVRLGFEFQPGDLAAFAAAT